MSKNSGMSAFGWTLTAILYFAMMMAFFYGIYWMAKTFSYWLFYEDMVRETIKQMVESGALR